MPNSGLRTDASEIKRKTCTYIYCFFNFVGKWVSGFYPGLVLLVEERNAVTYEQGISK